MLAGMAGAVHAQELLAPLPTGEERGVQVLLGMAAASFAIALAAAIRLKPREARAGIASVGAGLVVVASMVVILAAYLLVRPKAGYEGLIAFVVLKYGAIPFILVVLCVWSSILRGNATRLRVFAAWFGTLTAASIVATFFIAVRT